MKWKFHESLSRIRAGAKEEPRYFSTDLDYTTGLVGNCALLAGPCVPRQWMQKRKAGYKKARSQRQENIATHTQYLFIGLNKNQSEMTQFLTVHYHYTSDKALACGHGMRSKPIVT